MKLVRLRRVNGTSVYVNPETVVALYEYNDYTTTVQMSGDYTYVSHSFAVVAKALGFEIIDPKLPITEKAKK